jgi:hypothetical protein
MHRIIAAALIFCSLAAARTLVLDDFESADSLKNWRGKVALSPERTAHGKQSLRIAASPEGLVSQRLPSDWRGYDRLLFELYNPEPGIVNLSLRIYEDPADEASAYVADRRVFLIPGMNHVEVVLSEMAVSAGDRKLALDKVRQIQITTRGNERAAVVYLDNLRLVAGSEDPASASVRRPENGLVVLRDRSVHAGQVGPRDAIPESEEVKTKRAAAHGELAKLEKAIAYAQTMGIETIYQEIPLVLADLGLGVRPLLSWFNNDRSKSEMSDYVANSCRSARVALERLVAGDDRLPDTDDTQVGRLSVPPYPRLRGLKQKNGFFVTEEGEPLLALSLHSPSRKLTRFFATPLQHIESYTAGGGSRWTVDQSPVYEAFHKHPDARRVGWDGWCGHLIRDRWSMGGGREEVVICLESPHIRKAIEEFIQREAPGWKKNPDLLYNIMGYELQYICYCDRSQRMFRDWLKKTHSSVSALNERWNTRHTSFDEISGPPVKNSVPLPGTNRAQWFDWATFNQERFTGHMVWVKDVMRKLDPHTPITAGGSHSMLGGSNGTSGIDEELIFERVADMALHEGGGSTIGVDLARALSGGKMALADPELAGRARDLFPHFLHGKSVMQLFSWSSQPSDEYPSVTGSSIGHSWRWPLNEVYEMLRLALDIRRLNKEIAAFSSVPAEVAILYSRTSLVQIPPQWMRATSTPFLEELRRVYDGSLGLDARTTFISERQLLAGKARDYKVILVPAARHVPPEAAQALLDYAEQGGTLVISPESLIEDQYVRSLDTLEKLGVRVVKTTVPRSRAGALEQQYDQTLRQAISFTGAESVDIETTGPSPLKLRGRGLVQTLELRDGTESAARFADGSPAIGKRSAGRGRVYYLAVPLEPESYARFLDRVLDEARVWRPVRFTDADGRRAWRLEGRSVQRGREWLLYGVNHGAQPIEVRVALPVPARSITDLRRDVPLVPGEPLTLAPGETRLLRAR